MEARLKTADRRRLVYCCDAAVTAPSSAFRPYCAGVATRTRNVSEYMLVLALCLVVMMLAVTAPSSAPRSVTVSINHSVSGTVTVNWRPPRLPNGDITGISTHCPLVYILHCP